MEIGTSEYRFWMRMAAYTFLSQLMLKVIQECFHVLRPPGVQAYELGCQSLPDAAWCSDEPEASICDLREPLHCDRSFKVATAISYESYEPILFKSFKGRRWRKASHKLPLMLLIAEGSCKQMPVCLAPCS